MRINADFSRVAIVDRSRVAWIPSPAAGVDRIMLDRIGDEVARATSIVRYAAGCYFPRHEHAKGEEFLVLEGMFSDESGDYPAGSYVRNPPGSDHTPFSEDGCRILVKLRQFDAADLTPVVVDTRDPALWPEGEGTCELPLHGYGNERVAMWRIPAGLQFEVPADPGGNEIFIVSGSLQHGDDVLGAESWLRFPAGRAIGVPAVEDSILWVKRGHLPDEDRNRDGP